MFSLEDAVKGHPIILRTWQVNFELNVGTDFVITLSMKCTYFNDRSKLDIVQTRSIAFILKCNGKGYSLLVTSFLFC